MDEVDEQQGSGAVDLLWIPLGAGRRVVRRCGRVYESLVAWRERREPLQLYTLPSRSSSTIAAT